MEVVVDKEANIVHQEGSVPRNNSPASYRFADYLFKATGKQLYSMYSIAPLILVSNFGSSE